MVDLALTVAAGLFLAWVGLIIVLWVVNWVWSWFD